MDLSLESSETVYLHSLSSVFIFYFHNLCSHFLFSIIISDTPGLAWAGKSKMWKEKVRIAYINISIFQETHCFLLCFLWVSNFSLSTFSSYHPISFHERPKKSSTSHYFTPSPPISLHSQTCNICTFFNGSVIQSDSF